MGIIVCVGKMCRKCGQAFAVTREEIQLAKRGKKGNRGCVLNAGSDGIRR